MMIMNIHDEAAMHRPGLLIDQIDPHWILLWVEVVEGVIFVPENNDLFVIHKTGSNVNVCFSMAYALQ